MGFSCTWCCSWCGTKYQTVRGSKFVYRRERDRLVKRRKCQACLAKDGDD